MTVGEKIVRTEFNTSALDVVSQIKQKTAELLNVVVTLRPVKGDSAEAQEEKHKLVTFAMKAYEEAAMWAVKAATVK